MTASSTPPASLPDRLIAHLDRALRACTSTSTGSERPSPAANVDTGDELSDQERRQAAGLMRVNHAGEVAAQALYHGQSLTSRDAEVRATMQRSAEEELDHLAWCEQRVDDLGESVSVLTPLWYAGSFGIGALAGLVGDRFSLGFIAETERQVVRHLDAHLERLPAEDHASRAVLQAMREDEARHGALATAAGGQDLPEAVVRAMGAVSKIMTRTAYWL